MEYHEKILRNARYLDGITTYYVDVVCDTAADIPNPADHPEWEVGSELIVLENGGSKYKLSNARVWVKVNFDDLAEGGDDSKAQLNALIDRSITKIESDAESVGNNSFRYCTALTGVVFPVAKSVGGWAFRQCVSLVSADFSEVENVDASAFEECNVLTNLILRKESVASLAAKSAFTGTPIESGTGYIYVPAALVDTYKAATNWSNFASQFRALENFTVDGTIIGELDMSKI